MVNAEQRRNEWKMENGEAPMAEGVRWPAVRWTETGCWMLQVRGCWDPGEGLGHGLVQADRRMKVKGAGGRYCRKEDSRSRLWAPDKE